MAHKSPDGEHPLLAFADTRLKALRDAISADERASSSTSSLQKLRGDLQSELDAIEVVRTRYTEALNACLPINTIPVEILRAIFEIVAQSCRPCGPVNVREQERYRSREDDDDDPPIEGEMWERRWLLYSGGDLGWIRMLGHCCRRWRRVLLDHAALWADDFGSLPVAVEEVLARSNGLPLTMRTYGSSYRDCAASWDALLHNDLTHRVQKMYCVETRSGMLFKEDYAALTTCSFPALEYLYIEGNETVDGPRTSRPLISAPNLRRLEFMDVFIPVSSKVVEIANLTQTRRDGDRYASNKMMSPDDLLHLMETSQESLTVLELDSCLPLHLKDWSHSKHIHLPNLRSLIIRQGLNESDIVNFLDGLILSEKTLLTVVLLPFGSYMEAYGVVYLRQKFHKVVASMSTSGCDALSCTMTLDYFPRKVLHLKLYAQSSAKLDYTTAPNHPEVPALPFPGGIRVQRLDISTHFGSTDVTVEQLLLPVSQEANLQGITALEIGGSFAFEDVRLLLEQCTSCHTLRILSAHGDSVSFALRVLGESSPEEVVPNLRHISICSDPIAGYHHRGSSDESPPRVSCTQLVECLSTRLEKAGDMSAMPTTLTIDAYVVFEEEDDEVERMKLGLTGLVQDVNWRHT